MALIRCAKDKTTEGLDTFALFISPPPPQFMGYTYFRHLHIND